MLTRNDVSAKITTADNASETPDLSVQFYCASEETALAEPIVFHWFLSTDATAQTLCTDSTDVTEIAIKANGAILVEDSTNVMGVTITEATGLADFTITVADGRNVVLNVVMPNGKLLQSEVLTWDS